MIVAVVWMLLLGLGFHALLRRHLRLDDELAAQECMLAHERSTRSHLELALAQSNQTLCELARQQESVREHERRRIGRDIHDDLGQRLLALKIDLSLLHMSASGAHPHMAQRASNMMANLDHTIRSLRTVINNLRPQALDAGLLNAIEWQLHECTRVHGIPHKLQADSGALDGDPDAERDAALFRIVQESLSNIVRHAQASEIEVALAQRAHVLTLTIRDNGVGMAANRPLGGCGLAGIRERAAAMGASFAIDSNAGGTLLTLCVPVADSRLMRSA